jgi:hypothetical protein
MKFGGVELRYGHGPDSEPHKEIRKTLKPLVHAYTNQIQLGGVPV